MIAMYFVDFIFYSFLGWIWECCYCSVKEGQWQNRGFLFGPVCPIYGSSVVLVDVIFSHVPQLARGEISIFGIFLICMLGSAVMEFSTHWYLEKRFHATWWDYSDKPFNVQGRICPQVSIAFGIAGVGVVKYLLPAVAKIQGYIPVIVLEILAILFSAVLGADLALTEASLSSLLKAIESYKAEFDGRAEMTFQTMVMAPQKLEESVNAVKEGALLRSEQMRDLAEAYIARLTPPQIHVLRMMRKLDPRYVGVKLGGLTHADYLKNALSKSLTRKKNEKNDF